MQEQENGTADESSTLAASEAQQQPAGEAAKPQPPQPEEQRRRLEVEEHGYVEEVPQGVPVPGEGVEYVSQSAEAEAGKEALQRPDELQQPEAEEHGEEADLDVGPPPEQTTKGREEDLCRAEEEQVQEQKLDTEHKEKPDCMQTPGLSTSVASCPVDGQSSEKNDAPVDALARRPVNAPVAFDPIVRSIHFGFRKLISVDRPAHRKRQQRCWHASTRLALQCRCTGSAISCEYLAAMIV